VYDGVRFVSGADHHAALGERLVVVNSLSKPYAMTGWRIGFAVGPREVLRAAATIQAHDASQAPTVSQHAALAALTGTQRPLEAMVADYAARREWLIPALRGIPGITCAQPFGAFYAFPNVTGLCRAAGIASSDDLAMTLLRDAGVVTVAGEGFGAPGYMRLSYAAAPAALRDGLARIAGLAAGRTA
jgi:aspartate aminotransferase